MSFKKQLKVNKLNMILLKKNYLKELHKETLYMVDLSKLCQLLLNKL